MTQDTFHIQLKNTKDGLIIKGDPEASMCRQDFSYIMQGVNKLPSAIKLNGKYTAYGWYNQYFINKYPYLRERKEFELKFSNFIHHILKLKTYYNRDRRNANKPIDELQTKASYPGCYEELVHIFKTVHEAQWSALLSRWCLKSRKINIRWLLDKIRIPMFNDDAEYEQSLNPRARKEDYLQDSPNRFCDKRCVEILTKVTDRPSQ